MLIHFFSDSTGNRPRIPVQDPTTFASLPRHKIFPLYQAYGRLFILQGTSLKNIQQHLFTHAFTNPLLVLLPSHNSSPRTPLQVLLLFHNSSPSTLTISQLLSKYSYHFTTPLKVLLPFHNSSPSTLTNQWLRSLTHSYIFFLRSIRFLSSSSPLTPNWGSRPAYHFTFNYLIAYFYLTTLRLFLSSQHCNDSLHSILMRHTSYQS